MQLGGIGHDSDSHHVTNCMHSHSHYDKTGAAGGAGTQAGMSPQAFNAQERQADAQFSLSSWLEKTLVSGRKLWRGIWGSGGTEGVGGPGSQSGAEQTMAQIHDVNAAEGPSSPLGQDSLHTPQIAAAATALTQQQELHNNPWFLAVDRVAEQQGNLWQRMKVGFKNVAGQLAGHLPGKFLGAQAKGSFQTKQERPKEDLRKKSTFRKDEVEIECMLTDDSYLLDSYDKNGEYSRLSAR